MHIFSIGSHVFLSSASYLSILVNVGNPNLNDFSIIIPPRALSAIPTPASAPRSVDESSTYKLLATLRLSATPSRSSSTVGISVSRLVKTFPFIAVWGLDSMSHSKRIASHFIIRLEISSDPNTTLCE